MAVAVGTIDSSEPYKPLLPFSYSLIYISVDSKQYLKYYLRVLKNLLKSQQQTPCFLASSFLTQVHIVILEMK